MAKRDLLSPNMALGQTVFKTVFFSFTASLCLSIIIINVASQTCIMLLFGEDKPAQLFKGRILLDMGCSRFVFTYIGSQSIAIN